MGNALNRDINPDEVVRIKRKLMKPEYKALEFRRVNVLSGFGASKDTRGTAVFVKFLCDGEIARYSGDDLEEDTVGNKKGKE